MYKINIYFKINGTTRYTFNKDIRVIHGYSLIFSTSNDRKNWASTFRYLFRYLSHSINKINSK
jgi:hypothetical protein